MKRAAIYVKFLALTTVSCRMRFSTSFIQHLSKLAFTTDVLVRGHNALLLAW